MRIERILERAAVATPDDTAIVSGGDAVSFSRLHEDVGRLACGLRGLGLSPGDRLAVLLPNSVELATTILAAMKAGLAVVSLSTSGAPSQNGHMLKTTAARALVTSESLLSSIPAHYRETLSPIILTGGGFPGAVAYRDLATASPCGAQPADSESPADPIGLIVFTSGTTGLPKGVAHTQARLLERAGDFVRRLSLSRDDKTLLLVEAARPVGLVCQFLAMLMAGGGIVMSGFLPSGRFWELYVRVKPTYSISSPAYAAKIFSDPEAAKADHSRLRFWITGGDHPPLELVRMAQETTGRPLLNMFGLTEIGVVAIPPLTEENRPCSMGKPMPGVEMRLVDSQGRAVGSNETGQLKVRAKGMMAGYWDGRLRPLPPENDGWMDTRDALTVDGEGWYWFVNRAAEAIVHCGMNVATDQVRDTLAGHPAVEKAFVLGVPDRLAEQTPVAFYSLREAAEDPGEDSLRALLALHVDVYSVPRRILRVDNWPITAFGKVDRESLVRIALAAINPPEPDAA